MILHILVFLGGMVVGAAAMWVCLFIADAEKEVRRGS